MKQRTADYEWSFYGAKTKEYTHCYHIYPAMMIPQVARRLIKEYAPKNTKLIFDPYCGTGTSLLEAKLAGIDSIGTDLNPLAQLISKVKVTNYNINEIQLSSKLLEDEIFQVSFNLVDDVNLFQFKNIEYWFSQKSIKEISFLLNLIKTKISESLQGFFIVALSETLREVSYTRNSEFKLYRIPKEKIQHHHPDTFGIFTQKVRRNLSGLMELTKTGANTTTKVFGFNTCVENPLKYTKKEVDFVVTSPPYGDSKTTVAYGQFSRLSNQWLGIENANKIDSILMGGRKQNSNRKFISKYAATELKKIENIDKKRYEEVLNFLIDYQLSIKNISDAIRRSGRIAYVVGNRRVKGIQIPLDYITVELFENYGFKHMETIVREIPNKRMPKENSPSNKTGIKSKTMNNEYIVIMEKDS